MSQVNAPVKPQSIGLPLLTWKDPVKTGKVFGSLIAALVVLKSVNFLSLYFRLGAYTLAASAIAEYSGKAVTGTGFVSRFRPAYTNCFSSKASKFLESLAADLPQLEKEAQQLLYSFSIEKTLKAAGLFYILFKITSWFSLYTLVFTATVLAFSVPFVYEKYQVEINAAASQYSKLASEKAGEYSKLAQEKAAPYIKQADEKLGPVSKFIKQKYQVRTASTTVGETTPSAFTSGSTAETASTIKKTAAAEASKVAPAAKDAAAKVAAAVPTSTSTSNSFPSVPETTPLVDQIKQTVSDVKEEANSVDVDELKNDILKNKASAVNF